MGFLSARSSAAHWGVMGIDGACDNLFVSADWAQIVGSYGCVESSSLKYTLSYLIGEKRLDSSVFCLII